MIKILFASATALQFYDNAYLRRLGQIQGKIWRKALELLRFRLLRLMGGIGIKAKVLG